MSHQETALLKLLRSHADAASKLAEDISHYIRESAACRQSGAASEDDAEQVVAASRAVSASVRSSQGPARAPSMMSSSHVMPALPVKGPAQFSSMLPHVENNFLDDEPDVACHQASHVSKKSSLSFLRASVSSAVTSHGDSSFVGSSLKAGLKPISPAEEFAKTWTSAILEEAALGRNAIAALVASPFFDGFSAIVICANALFIGVQTDYMSSSDVDSTAQTVFYICKICFTVLFSIELLLRIYVLKCGFFCSSASWAWNYFDIFVVVVSVLDVSLSNVVESDQSSTVDLSSMRLLRIIRITRLVRVIRMGRLLRFVRALRDLVMSILGTMKALLWSLVLLSMILYGFAIAFTQAVIDSARTGHRVPDLDMFFGSTTRSMFTLFKTITNGVSWHEVVTPLEEVGVLYVVLFVCYVSFACFAVLNVITSAFCSSAMEGSQKDFDTMIHNQMKHSKTYSALIGELFHGLDVQNHGFLTRSEFVEGLSKPDLQAFLTSLDLDSQDATMLFDLLDVDHSEIITMDQFVMGCVRLKGAARNVDMARMLQHGQWTMKALRMLMTKIDTVLMYTNTKEGVLT